MAEQLGRITPKQIPASQAIPGNPQHAAMIKQMQGGGGMLPAQKPASKSWAHKVKTTVLGPAVIGFVTLGLFVAGFGVWASSAPISGAAVATGVVSASGQNMRVQHFEGGIIDEILVAEGQKVTKGEPLMKLDETTAKASRERLQKGLIALRAQNERLEAERDNAADFQFSESLIKDALTAGLETDLDEQRREFKERAERYLTDAKIVDKQVEAVNEQIIGLESQMKSARDQLAVIQQEIGVKRRLVKRKLTPLSDLLRLRRSRSELEGRLGGFQAGVAEAKSTILRAEEQKARLRAERAETAATSLNRVRGGIAESQELLKAAENVLERVIVRAPTDGVVVKISKNTPGSVVRQGEDLFEILPNGGELIVEARLSPQDVDVVTIGQSASLLFSALNQRTTPNVPGVVTYVSADRLVDPQTNEPYYTARLKIADQLPDSVDRSQIFPGMPVETFIVTGDRTFLEYLAQPLTDSFNRAFREQ